MTNVWVLEGNLEGLGSQLLGRNYFSFFPIELVFGLYPSVRHAATYHLSRNL